MKYILILFMSFLFQQQVFAVECSAASDATRVTVAGGSITEIMYMIDAEDSIML